MQIAVLKQLLNMPAAARSLALAGCLSPQPNPATLWRTPSLGSRSSQDRNSDDNSVGSADSRIHHTGNAVNKLAKHISKTFFASEAIWKVLYNKKNRVDVNVFENILAQVKTQLSRKQKAIFKNNPNLLKKKLKKKIAADRHYRSKIEDEEKKKKLVAPLAHAIDLTFSDDEDDDEDDGAAGGSDDGAAGGSDDGAGGGADGGEDGGEDGGVDGGLKKKEPNKKDEEDGGQQDDGASRKAKADKFIAKLETIRGKGKVKGKKPPVKPKASRVRAKPQASRVRTKRRRATRANPDPDNETQTPSKKSKPDSATTPTKSPSSSTASPSRWKDRPISSTQVSGPTFEVGSKVSGAWKGPACKGDWYDGVVMSINDEARTAHVLYNDGDRDKNLKWSNIRLL